MCTQKLLQLTSLIKKVFGRVICSECILRKTTKVSDESDLCTYLKPEPVQPHASEVKHVSILH